MGCFNPRRVRLKEERELKLKLIKFSFNPRRVRLKDVDIDESGTWVAVFQSPKGSVERDLVKTYFIGALLFQSPKGSVERIRVIGNFETPILKFYLKIIL